VEQLELKPGDLYSVLTGDARGGYQVAKLLAVDDQAVHIRLYAERFEERPAAIGSDSLSLGTIHGGDFGMGHLPIAHGVFLSWEPVLVSREPLTEEELEGYRIWQDERGGVFGTDESSREEEEL
jgi:hypothetical protein